MALNDNFFSRSLPVKEFTRTSYCILSGIIFFSVVIRLFYQYERSPMGDEVGTLIYLQKDYLFLLTKFFEPWMTCNYYLVLLKFLNEIGKGTYWVLVMPSFLAGIALVPLVSLLSLRITDKNTALIAAFLTAVNPMFIRYSVTIRPYMLLVTFSVCALIFFLDWMESPGWRTGIWFSLFSLLSLLAHPNAAYHLVFMGGVFLLWLRYSLPQFRIKKNYSKITSLAGPMICVIGATFFLYFRFIDQMTSYREGWAHFPPSTITYLPRVLNLFFATGFNLIPTIILLILGGLVASQRKPRMMLLLLGIFVPVFISSIVGSSFESTDMARFLITTLPLQIILIAGGVTYLTRKKTAVLLALILSLLTITWSPNIYTWWSFKYKYPWAEISEYFNANINENDRIIGLQAHVKLHMWPYVAKSQTWPQFSGSTVTSNNFTHAKRFFGVNEVSPIGKLFVVVDRPFKSTFPVKQIGDIRIIEYRGETRREIGINLLDELMFNADSKVDETLQSYYQSIVQLMSALSIEKDIPKYLILYYECIITGAYNNHGIGMMKRRERNRYSDKNGVMLLEEVGTVTPFPLSISGKGDVKI